MFNCILITTMPYGINERCAQILSQRLKQLFSHFKILMISFDSQFSFYIYINEILKRTVEESECFPVFFQMDIPSN